MSQTLSFEVPQHTANLDALNELPDHLGDDYRVEKIADGCFEITSAHEGLALYQFDDSGASLEGGIDDFLYDRFAALCDQHNATLLLEGEPIIAPDDEYIKDSTTLWGLVACLFVGFISVIILLFSLLLLPIRLLFSFRKK